MKHLLKAVLLGVSGFGIFPAIALGSPLEGKIGLNSFVLPTAFSGLAEIGLKDHPLGIGVQASYVEPRYSNYYVSAWGSYALAATQTSSFGLVAGVNQSWSKGRMYTPGRPLFDQGLRLVLGVSYEHRWERFRLRATPNLVPMPNFSLATPQFNWMDTFMTGPAWLELGYRFHPSWELSLRSTVMPLGLSMLF
ncbi:hypothetical protein D3C72_179220 [compost metagenome]